MSRSDRRAALILLALAALGLGVRWFVETGGPTGAVAYRPGGAVRPPRDSVAAQAARHARPLGRGETIDLDRAPAEELTRLPRIGPALARRIVQYRDAHGPFGTLQAFDRVPGIGPTTLAAVAPHARFSGADRPDAASSWEGLGGPERVSLNTATVDELMQLPGVGPGRARAIVDDRERRGPYRSLDDLTRVRGIGPAIVAQLRERVRVP